MQITTPVVRYSLVASATPKRPGASGARQLGLTKLIKYPDSTVVHSLRLKSSAAGTVEIDLATLALTGDPWSGEAQKADGTDFEGLDFGADLAFLNAIVLDRTDYTEDEDVNASDIVVTIGTTPTPTPPMYVGRPVFDDLTHIGLSPSGISLAVLGTMTVEFFQADQIVTISFIGTQA